MADGRYPYPIFEIFVKDRIREAVQWTDSDGTAFCGIQERVVLDACKRLGELGAKVYSKSWSQSFVALARMPSFLCGIGMNVDGLHGQPGKLFNTSSAGIP